MIRYPLRFIVVVAWLPLLSIACKPRDVPVATDTSSVETDLFAVQGEVIDEYWHAHYLGDTKFGHRHTRRIRTGNGDSTQVKTIAVDHLELRRFAQVNHQELTTVSVEAEDGKIQRFGYRLLTSGREEPTIVKGRVRDDGTAELSHAAGMSSGKSSGKMVRIRWSDRQEGLFAVARSLRHRPMEQGETRRIEAFIPVTDQTATLQLSAKGMEPTEVGDRTERLLRVDVMDLHPNSWKIPSSYWCRSDGRIMKIQEPFMSRRTVVVEQHVATGANDTYRIDLGIDTGVRVARPMRHAAFQDQMVYRVKLDGLSPAKIFPDSLSQQVTPSPENDNEALIEVQRVSLSQPPDPPKIDPPTSEDLSSNQWIQSDHPRIVGLAKAIASGDPWQFAQSAERYLHGLIDEQNYAKVFNTAAEVIEQEAGDCSEHAVLLAALCRAQQIPARVVVGLVYDESRQSFLYHMWNEVWISDRWLSLDATRGRGGIGPTYLKLRHSSLASQNAYGIVAPVIYLMDRLQIEPVGSSTEAKAKRSVK